MRPFMYGSTGFHFMCNAKTLRAYRDVCVRVRQCVCVCVEREGERGRAGRVRPSMYGSTGFHFMCNAKTVRACKATKCQFILHR